MSRTNNPSRQLLAVLVGLAVVVAAGVFGARLLREEPTEFSAMFDSAVGLYPGSDVQVLGVPIGKVTAVEPNGDGIEVTMQLDSGQKVAPDTGAVIVAPTLVSDRYVQLTEPWEKGAALKTGAEIDKTAVPVEIDQMYESLAEVSQALGPKGANRNGALSEMLTVAADNLDGQGADINDMLTEFGQASATVSGFDDEFFETVTNLNTLNTTLLERDRGVASANQRFATVTRYLAEDRENFALAIRDLGQALSVLEGFIKDNRGALKRSVDNLTGPTQVLVNQRKSLEETVRTIPLALQNYINAYDQNTNTLSGRANLNELTVWSRSQDGKTARTSPEAPPVLLPGVDGEE